MGGKFIKLLLVLLAFVAAPAAVAQSAGTRDIHVDCSAVVNGDGSAQSPMNSIVEPFDLRPDYRLLFRRGSVCTGTLEVTAGHHGAQPTTIGAYGSGPLPKIVGDGKDAVWLRDVSNLTVRDLDISNPGDGGPLGSGSSIRNGIRATAHGEDVRNLTLMDLVIHDVNGDLTKSWDGSAAIQVSATGPPPMRFANLTISGNKITSVSRSAISISGTADPNRPAADQPWPSASTGVVVENNRIDLIAGDGIVPRGTNGAIVRGNVVSRGNLAGRAILDPAGAMCNAGIWTFRSNNTLIQGNEVFDMEHNGCDGTGFDIDYRQDGTIIEGNYSHGNEGGFVLLCSDDVPRTAEVRFNLSVDDGTMINHGPCGITEGIIGDLSGIRMYNNTVVGDSPTTTMQLAPVEEMFLPGDFQFANNLIYSRKPIESIVCGERCSHNAFFGLPASGTDAITSDPLLKGPLVAGTGMAAADGFRLSDDSPLRGSGLTIPSGATKDFFGNPVNAAPAIGFDQTPATETKPDPACQKSRAARSRAQLKAKRLARRLNKLKRQRRVVTRGKRVARQIRKTRTGLRQQTRTIRKLNRTIRNNCSV